MKVYIVILSFLNKCSDEEPDRRVWKVFSDETLANRSAREYLEEFEKTNSDLITDYDVIESELVNS